MQLHREGAVVEQQHTSELAVCTAHRDHGVGVARIKRECWEVDDGGRARLPRGHNLQVERHAAGHGVVLDQVIVAQVGQAGQGRTSLGDHIDRGAGHGGREGRGVQDAQAGRGRGGGRGVIDERSQLERVGSAVGAHRHHGVVLAVLKHQNGVDHRGACGGCAREDLHVVDSGRQRGVERDLAEAEAVRHQLAVQRYGDGGIAAGDQ